MTYSCLTQQNVNVHSFCLIVREYDLRPLKFRISIRLHWMYVSRWVAHFSSVTSNFELKDKQTMANCKKNMMTKLIKRRPRFLCTVLLCRGVGL